MLHRFRTALIVLCTLALVACGDGIVKRVSEPAASLQQLTVQANGDWTVALRLQNYSSMPMSFDDVALVLTIGDTEAGPLSAVLDRGHQPAPAAIDELFVGGLETRRRGHLVAGRIELAANLVTHAVERGQHAGAEAAGFFQHGIDDISGGVGEAQAGEQRFDLQHIVQAETKVGKRGGVAAHRCVSI